MPARISSVWQPFFDNSEMPLKAEGYSQLGKKQFCVNTKTIFLVGYNTKEEVDH